MSVIDRRRADGAGGRTRKEKQPIKRQKHSTAVASGGEPAADAIPPALRIAFDNLRRVRTSRGVPEANAAAQALKVCNCVTRTQMELGLRFKLSVMQERFGDAAAAAAAAAEADGLELFDDEPQPQPPTKRSKLH